MKNSMLISSMRKEPMSLEEWHNTGCVSKTFSKECIWNSAMITTTYGFLFALWLLL
jgi:hypothetical protein